jgi:hypothetical protein
MSVIQALRSHFDFLDTEYGLKPYRLPSDRSRRKWSPWVGFANRTTGVYVEFDVRDSYLAITLHALKDGAFPILGGRVATAQAHPLNSIIYLSDPKDLIYPWVGTDSIQTGANSLDGYFAEAAAKLKRHADDFLRGDFGRSPLIPSATQEIFENSLRKT